MSNGFIHSVVVPRIYKITANIVRRVREDGASLKSLIYEKNHPNKAGIYGLSMNTLQMLAHLEQLFDKTHILKEQPRLDPWLARVLVTELLWGKKCLKGHSKPIVTVLAYEKKFQEELKSFNHIETFTSRKEKAQKPRYVRVNTLLLSVKEAIDLFQKEGWQLLSKSTTYSSYLQALSQLLEPYFIQDFHIPEVFAFPPLTSFHEHAGYQNGELILQDKASCLSTHLLNPPSGSIVLDMCAAPGMKTTHIAAKLQNSGKVYAVEIDAKRFETLSQQIEITHSSCVKLVNQDALTLDPKQYSNVEYILVDPSCSGSGMVDRPGQGNDMNNEPLLKRLQNLQSVQVYLLRYALLNFPNAKRIIYSTCSLHPEENEEVIDEVLADIGNAYCLIPTKQLLENNWMNFSSKKYNCRDKCLYSKPNIDFCNGFFVAVFERNFDVALPMCKRKGGNVNPSVANLYIKENDTVKKVKDKQKQREERKKKKEEKKINDGQIKTSSDVNEFVESQSKGGNVNPSVANLYIKENDTVKKVKDKQKQREERKKKKEEKKINNGQIKTSSDVNEFVESQGNKVGNEIETKRNEKDKIIDSCSLSNFNQEEITLNRSEDTHMKVSEDIKQKKSKKKKSSKYENLFFVENKMIKINDYEEKEVNEENRIEPPKKKKKKDKEILKIEKEGSGNSKSLQKCPKK